MNKVTKLDAFIAEKVMKVSPSKSYSTNLNEAWEVVRQLMIYNPFWNEEYCMHFDLKPVYPSGWSCNFGDQTTIVRAETAAEAICLAAAEILSTSKK